MLDAGQLSWEEFLENSHSFLEKSQKLNDNWTFVQVNAEPGGSYLRYKKYHKFKLKTQEEKIFLFEYHVLYSISYSVPMFYFIIHDTDGNLLNLEEISEIFIERAGVDRTEIDIYSALTQLEHPLYFRPYFAIHPCKTATFLSKVEDSKNKLLTFISMLGPLICLDLDLMYGKT